MGIEKTQRYCPECERNVLGEKTMGAGCLVGLVLTIVTGGLFLPIFALMALNDSLQPFRCPLCGAKTKPPKKKKMRSFRLE